MGFFDNIMRGFDFNKKPEQSGRNEIFNEKAVPVGTAPEKYNFEAPAAFNGKITKDASNMLVFTPASFDDVETIIDHLKTGESVILNLRDIKEQTAQRILDFIAGAIYALSGCIYPIENALFALTPSGVNILTQKKP